MAEFDAVTSSVDVVAENSQLISESTSPEVVIEGVINEAQVTAEITETNVIGEVTQEVILETQQEATFVGEIYYGGQGEPGEPGEPWEDGREVEIQTTATHIQWRYVWEASWINLIALSELEGAPGDPGEPGEPWEPGAEVELQSNGTYIQWRYVGAPTWTNLVALSALQGPPGDPATDTKQVKRNSADTEGYLNAKLQAGVEGVKSNPVVGTTQRLNNGSFTGNANNWTVPAGMAYSGNTVVKNGNGVGALTQTSAQMLTPLIAYETITITYTITGLTGNITPSIGGRTLTTRTTSGTFTETVTILDTTQLAFTPSNTARWTSIDDIILATAYTGGDVQLQNQNVATAMQHSLASPAVEWEAQGWTWSAARVTKYRASNKVLTGSGGTNPTAKWLLEHQTNNGAWTPAVEYDNKIDGKGFTIYAYGHSNGNPGTTRAVTIENTGSYSHIDFKFTNTVRSAISANNSGDIILNFTGRVMFYGGSTINSVYYRHEINQYGAYIGWYGAFTGRVSAGYGTTNSKNYLQTAGSLGFKYRYVGSNYAVTDEDLVLYMDTTYSSSCSGSPTACSSYTSSATCNAKSALGCGWTGGDCSARSFEDCESQSPCSKTTENCNSAGDSESCYGQNNSYGGSCSWSEFSQDCSSFDEEACNSNTGAGCSVSTASCYKVYYCNQWNNDETGCNDHSGDGCGYDTGSGICSGGSYSSCGGGGSCSSYDEYSCDSSTYFEYCSGTMYYYVCDGTYYTGSCGGGEYGTCTGTASCWNLGTEVACEAEGGCNWTEGLAVSLPSVLARVENNIGPILKLYKVAGTGAVTVTAYSGDTLGAGSATSITMSTNDEAVELHAAVIYGSCSNFDDNESACNSRPGCGFSSVCSGWSSQEDCEANSCSWDSENNTCYGGTAGYCGGSYIIQKKWHIHNRYTP